jgi:hypothetical protein
MPFVLSVRTSAVSAVCLSTLYVKNFEFDSELSRLNRCEIGEGMWWKSSKRVSIGRFIVEAEKMEQVYLALQNLSCHLLSICTRRPLTSPLSTTLNGSTATKPMSSWEGKAQNAHWKFKQQQLGRPTPFTFVSSRESHHVPTETCDNE